MYLDSQPKIKQDQFRQDSQQFKAGECYQMQDMNFKLKTAQFFLKRYQGKKILDLFDQKSIFKEKTVVLFEPPLKLKSI